MGGGASETKSCSHQRFCSDFWNKLCVWAVCMKNVDVHDYHQGNTAGLWARWSSECVHTALRRTHLVPCTAVLILQDRWHHDWLNHVWSDQLETFGWSRKHGVVCRVAVVVGRNSRTTPKTKLWNDGSNTTSCSQLRLHLCCLREGKT